MSRHTKHNQKTGKKKSNSNKNQNIYAEEHYLQQAEYAASTTHFELAHEMLSRAQAQYPQSTRVIEAMAELHIQTGDFPKACELLQQSIAMNPTENATKWLYLAQFTEGEDSLNYYRKGIEILESKISEPAALEETELQEFRHQLCTANCSVADLFLTDLCELPEAEENCQKSLDAAMSQDPEAPEVYQGLANLRLSQNSHLEATRFIQEAYRRSMALDPLPEFEFRVMTVKILLECNSYDGDCAEQALEVLHSLIQEDDENVEIWYLMGVAFFTLKKPDYELSRHHLETAAQMLEKIRETMNKAGEIFIYDDQVKMVTEQLQLVNETEKIEPADDDEEEDGDEDDDDDGCDDDENDMKP